MSEFCLDSFTNLAFFVMFWNKSELSGWPSQPYFLSSKEVKQFHGKQKKPCICTGLHWFPIWRLCRICILHFDWRFLICSTNVKVSSDVSNMNSTKSRQLCGTFLESKDFFSIVIHRDDVLRSMSISNLPTCVVHQIFTTITQSSLTQSIYMPIQNTSS